jgi:LPXTG-motif cell wall-anchored protein
MKAMKKLFALLVLNILSLPYVLMAQNEGTYIDNLNVQDSSYLDEDLLAGAGQSSNSTTIIIIVVAVVVIAVGVFLYLKKKKK